MLDPDGNIKSCLLKQNNQKLYVQKDGIDNQGHTLIHIAQVLLAVYSIRKRALIRHCPADLAVLGLNLA